MPNPPKPRDRSRRRGTRALIEPSDVRAYLLEKSASIAPADIDALLDQRQEVLDKAAAAGVEHPLFQRQVKVAVMLLEDHASGEASQIPYSTVSLLAVAFLYLLQPLGLIPDFIPGVGMSDDALVFELACELGSDGLERYCLWKEIPIESVLGRPMSVPRKR